jgi:hypothetical protein
MTATKIDLSAKEVQKQVGMKIYEPDWRAIHNIREAMGYEITDINKLICLNWMMFSSRPQHPNLPRKTSK